MVSGTRLGPYEVLTKIGEGGMGSVYKARDTRLDRIVAVKQSADAFTERFERETRAIAALNHSHICQLYDVGPNYIVMEYVDGVPLPAPVPLRQAMTCADQILDALHAAHSAGIVHRDLKPANILLTKSGVKVLDFGLARYAPSTLSAANPGGVTRTVAITGPNAVLGTPNYMSPEQIRAQEVDARSDIFAFGLIFYELLSGKRAYDGDSAVDVMSSVLKEPLPELSTEFPAAVRQIIADCTAKDREDRYGSANDIRLALRAVSVSSPSLPAVEVRPRRRWLTPALAVACLGLTALAVFQFLRTPARVHLGPQKLTPVASDRAEQNFGAWSHDGQSIAYVAGEDASAQLMVRNLNASLPVRVADLQGTPRPNVAWFPSGDRILFVAGDSVYATRLAGGEPQKMVTGEISSAALSPDGTILAVWRMAEVEGNRRASLWYSSPPGSPLRPWPGSPQQNESLAGVNIRFSPNGSHIGLISRNPGGKIMFWTLPWPSDGAAAVSRFGSYNFSRVIPQFDWFPDGRHVVVTDIENRRLLLGDVESGWMKPFMGTVAGTLVRPAISPNGSKILMTTRIADFNIAEFPLDGSQARPFRTTTRDESSASASASGDLVTFVTTHSGSPAIWARSFSAGGDRPVVTGADFPDGRRTTAFFGTALSPDGSKVAYVRTAEATDRELYLSPISGGRPVRLDYGANGSIPAWSPDSRKLAILLFQNGSPRLAVVEPGTGDGPKWLPGACRTAPAWSPDGKWIACGSSATHSLLLVSPDGAVTRSVGNLLDVDASRFGLAWTTDSARVLVASSDRGSARLSSVDIRTGARSLIADYGDTFRFQATTTYTLAGSLLPSRKSVLFTTLTQRTEISMAEEFPDPRTLH